MTNNHGPRSLSLECDHPFHVSPIEWTSELFNWRPSNLAHVTLMTLFDSKLGSFAVI